MSIPASLCNDLANILGGIGQTRNGLCKIEIPRTDINVTILGLPSKAAPTHMIVFERNNGRSLETGDLVLLQEEVPAILAQLTDTDIIVSAVHNHWIMDEPHLIYIHIQACMEPRAFARVVARIIGTLNTQADTTDDDNDHLD